MCHKDWSHAFKEELNLINQRRGKNPNDKTDLVGLAISGGGIRSATFGLGILEGLKHYGLLKKIDYLSTVSGGGYRATSLKLLEAEYSVLSEFD